MSSIPLSTHQVAQASPQETRVSWYVWFGALAVTSASIGGAWDVSWHRSIGRDTFWTPAHLAIQACGVMAAIICGYLMLVNTFGRSANSKAASVNVLMIAPRSLQGHGNYTEFAAASSLELKFMSCIL